MIDLSKDKDVLSELYIKSKDPIEKDRFHALFIRSLGYTRKTVSEMFCKDEDTILTWEKKWIEERDVKDKQREGRPKEIDEKTEKLIVKMADENKPQKYGMNCSCWDCSEFRKFFLMHGIAMSQEAIRKVLKKNGFRYVKADYEFAQADENEKAKFLKELSQIIENKGVGDSILFFDEMGTLLHPKKGYMWTRKKKAIVKTFSSHEKDSVFGAVNPLTGTKEVMQTSDGINENTFIRFLDKMYCRFKGTVYFILDKYVIHYKSKKVKEWVQLHPRFKFIFIPSYSPKLNVQEWLWGFSRKKFLNNRVFMTVRQLMSSYWWFLRKLSRSTIKRVCNINILLNRTT